MKRNKFYIAFMIFSLYNTFVSGTCGGTGRRCRLKICCPQGRAGSTPAIGIFLRMILTRVLLAGRTQSEAFTRFGANELRLEYFCKVLKTQKQKYGIAIIRE